MLGLRFAGTGCSVTAATLQHFLMHFKVLRGINDVASTASKKSKSRILATAKIYD